MKTVGRNLAPDNCALLECRIVDGWNYGDIAVHLGVPLLCFGGPGASAANGSAEEGKGARSLRLRRRRTGRGTRTAGLLKRPVPATLEAALPLDGAKPKTPAISAPPAPVLAALPVERPPLPLGIVRTP